MKTNLVTHCLTTGSDRGRNLLVQSSLTQDALCNIFAVLGLNALGQLCLQNLGRRNELADTMLSHLRSEPRDELLGRHCVEFNAMGLQPLCPIRLQIAPLAGRREQNQCQAFQA